MKYLNGSGVPQDKERAYFWLKKSADQGHKTAQETLEDFHQYRFYSNEPKDQNDRKSVTINLEPGSK
jgi:TPR repeat protein